MPSKPKSGKKNKQKNHKHHKPNPEINQQGEFSVDPNALLYFCHLNN